MDLEPCPACAALTLRLHSLVGLASQFESHASQSPIIMELSEHCTGRRNKGLVPATPRCVASGLAAASLAGGAATGDGLRVTCIHMRRIAVTHMSAKVLCDLQSAANHLSQRLLGLQMSPTHNSQPPSELANCCMGDGVLQCWQRGSRVGYEQATRLQWRPFMNVSLLFPYGHAPQSRSNLICSLLAALKSKEVST